MEQVIGDKENEREVRGRIESAFRVSILQREEVHSSKTNVVFTDNDVMQAMLYLTPYSAAVRRKSFVYTKKNQPSMADIMRVETNLINVECQDEERLYKNYMEKLMPASLAYQHQLNMPFCFVKTDREELFERYGFHYIQDRPQYELNRGVISEQMLARAEKGEVLQLDLRGVTLQAADSDSLLSLAHFVNATLCRNYGIFIIRSASYYEQFRSELQSTGGNLFQIMQDGQLRGCFAYTGDSADAVGEAVFADAFERELFLLEKREKKPSVMARVVNLPEMLKQISGNGKITIAIRIHDPVITENDGTFLWYIDETGSYMERVEQTADSTDSSDLSMRPEVTATIGEFTAFIFEYITLKQNAKFDNIYLAGPAWMNTGY